VYARGIDEYLDLMTPTTTMRTRIAITLMALLSAATWADAAPANDVVGRAAWQARSPGAGLSTWDEYGIEPPAYTRIVLHVTSKGHGTGAAEARRIQDFQMDIRGFADIAYNFLVDSEGTVFEGRSLDVVPAHAGRTVEGDTRHDITLDPDYGSIGIAFSADTDESLSEAQVRSAIALIAQLRAEHPIDSVITHTEVGVWIRNRGLTPQGSFDPGLCPGPGSIEQVVRIREIADPSFDADAYRALFGSPSTGD